MRRLTTRSWRATIAVFFLLTAGGLLTLLPEARGRSEAATSAFLAVFFLAAAALLWFPRGGETP